MQDRFVADIKRNVINAAILERWHEVALPDAWLVAGCLFQTVWNLHDGHAASAHIKDYDIFYFDPTRMSEGDEEAVQRRVSALFADLGATIEASNQARVHLWYPTYFGEPYDALRSTQDGIDRFLVKETCVGIQPHAIHAPHSIEAIYQGVLSRNPAMPHRRLFEQKVESYVNRWPWLRVRNH